MITNGSGVAQKRQEPLEGREQESRRREGRGKRTACQHTCLGTHSHCALEYLLFIASHSREYFLVCVREGTLSHHVYVHENFYSAAAFAFVIIKPTATDRIYLFYFVVQIEVN